MQAGVTRKHLNEYLGREGLFFPVDPGADATLGGMAATGASGTTTVRYGAMRENVLSLRAVLADGRIITTAHRARKTSAGYDLTRLFVGSEGTLGVITELTLKVFGLPEAISSAICHFHSVEDAVGAVITILQMGIPVARVEFLDEQAMKAVNNFAGLDYPIAPTLFLEFHGSSAGVAEEAEGVREIVTEAGAIEFRGIDGPERANEAVASAPRFLLRVACFETRGSSDHDRRVRPDLAPGRMHPRESARHRRAIGPRHHRRACR